MDTNNIYVQEEQIYLKTQGVIQALLGNKHNNGSNTNSRLNSIYTEQSIKLISTKLFTALNTFTDYEPINSTNSIIGMRNPSLSTFDEFKKFCIKLFEYDLRKTSNNIYDKLILDKNNCQYCFVRSVNALDHYFDKSTSPELAIVPDNLIPICSNCNSQKGKKRFIYPYFSVLLNTNWLKCTVNADKTFAFEVNNNFAKNNFESEILDKYNQQLMQHKIFEKYITPGQTLVIDRISEIQTYKFEIGMDKAYAKKIIKKRNDKIVPNLLKNTEFYKIAILNGIIDDFDKIWNNVTIL
ncbi:HNH endonuclease [Periweissella ghanensis]|uniref:HNH domain-containing protein n=1 Tax=Periweissella ghanensis TaxID=467997 RepID=A0ABM8ZDA2_9LACO|nr:HNH endonuclease [Periweissella ghanensis]MCM0601404.1 HNH endonuclease [Periweissella ghanensis]CAH0419450.1 hypothetical protein WGH24286_01909 [Periweissella ghanensis]